MHALSAITDRIDQLLKTRPDGVTATTVVTELSRQGLRGDDVAAALTEGVNYRKYDVDAMFRVTAAHTDQSSGWGRAGS